MSRCQSDNQHVFNRCTRSSISDIILPKFRLDVAKKSFYYHGACTFNSLPTNIQKVLTYNVRYATNNVILYLQKNTYIYTFRR